MKKLAVGVLVLAMLVTLCGCGELVGQLMGENDEHVQFVKGGTNAAYPGVTYGEAFENFFTRPSWRYFKGTQEGPDDDDDGKPDYTVDDVDVVEFTGRCIYADTEVTALIQFKLNMDDGTFQPTFLSFNDVPQNFLMLAGLLDTVFTQAQEELGASTTPPPTETQTPPTQDIADDPPSDPGDVSGEYYFDSQNGYYIDLGTSSPNRDGTFGFIISGEKYLGGDLFRMTQSDYIGETIDGTVYEFRFDKPNDSVFMEVIRDGTVICTVQRDARFLEGSYAGYDLYAWQGEFREASGSISIELLVLPSEVEYHCALNWNYSGISEYGSVAPGSPAVLSQGTVITLDLNPDGTISVLLTRVGPDGFNFKLEMYQ